ncbi:MAG: glycosyltransferase family 4 protein [Myxococcota bacterium]
MHIGLVHPRLDHRGGAENVVLWMAQALRRRGHRVTVVARKFSAARWNDGDWDGITLHTLPERYWDRFRTRRVRKALPGRRLAQLLGPDCGLIVAHNSPAQVWAREALRSLPDTRVVWFCEEPRARFYWQQTQPTIAAAMEERDRYTWAAEGFADRDRLSRDHARARVDTDRAQDLEAGRQIDRVLGNSVFTAKVAAEVYGRDVVPCTLGMPEPEYVPVPASEAKPYVAWVAANEFHKNVAGALEALRIAVHELGATDLRVRITGLNAERHGPVIDAARLGDHLVLEGWRSDAELNALVAGCRFLLFPSVDEPFGLVPVHAMAHGRAVLAGNTGGPAETVLDDVNGVNVDALDPQAMAAALVALWRDPDRADALGARGRERYRAEFTFDHFMDRFEALVGPL